MAILEPQPPYEDAEGFCPRFSQLRQLPGAPEQSTGLSSLLLGPSCCLGGSLSTEMVGVGVSSGLAQYVCVHALGHSVVSGSLRPRGL